VFRNWNIVFFVILSVYLIGCKSSPVQPIQQTQSSNQDSIIDDPKIELGKLLFFDKRLSRDESISCASCHIPNRAFASNEKVAIGIDGRKNLRNTPTILNLANHKAFMFDGVISTLEMQALVPIQDHNEMDIPMNELIIRLTQDKRYEKFSRDLFRRSIDPTVITKSLAAYVRSLTSLNSRFDQFYYSGKTDVLTPDEKAGWNIFSAKLNCITCHALPNFTTGENTNNGLYEVYSIDPGRLRATNLPSDEGSFKIPSLRNIELTYPYMHDGSLPDLEDVILHYSKGGKSNSHKNPLVKPFNLSDKEVRQLIAFFKSLTDTSYILH
jgi:cytochrome c peroxidase